MLPIFQRRISVKDSRFEIKEGQNLKIFEICDHQMALNHCETDFVDIRDIKENRF